MDPIGNFLNVQLEPNLGPEAQTEMEYLDLFTEEHMCFVTI